MPLDLMYGNRADPCTMRLTGVDASAVVKDVRFHLSKAQNGTKEVQCEHRQAD